MKRKMSGMGAALLQGTWDPDMEMLPPIVNALLYFEKAPEVSAIANAVEHHLWPCHRFSSTMQDGNWIPGSQEMDRSYHFQEIEVSGEPAIVDIVNRVMMEDINMSHPAWQFITYRSPPSSRSAVLFRCHHSIGDGLGLLFAMSPLLGCQDGDPMSKVPLPNSMLPASARKSPTAADASNKVSRPRAGDCCASACAFCSGAMVPLTVKSDSDLVLNAALKDRVPFLKFNKQRVYTRLPPISMSRISAVRKNHSCSVNDALMAALTGALRRYGAEQGDPLLKGDGQSLEFKSMLMIALPRPLDENDYAGSLCNNMLFASCPLPIDESSPDRRMGRVIEACEKLKSKAYMGGLVGLTNFLQSAAPSSVLRKAASEVFSKHSLLVTNVPGMTCPVWFPREGGETMQEIQMVFPNVVTQFSLLSYNGSVHGNIVADPALFADPELFGRMWVEEFEILSEIA